LRQSLKDGAKRDVHANESVQQVKVPDDT
jgi:hypothetical protein